MKIAAQSDDIRAEFFSEFLSEFYIKLNKCDVDDVCHGISFAHESLKNMQNAIEFFAEAVKKHNKKYIECDDFFLILTQNTDRDFALNVRSTSYYRRASHDAVATGCYRG